VITFEDLMVLIGQNNHGKSNILSALLFFFGEISIDPLDFHSTSDELFVEVEFANLDESDARTFKKYMTTSNGMKVRKIATKESGFSHHGYIEIPEEDWLQEENISTFTKRETAEQLPLSSFLPDAGRITKEIFKQAQEQYIEAHQNELSFNYQLETGPFLGAKNVAKGIFGQVYFVPSVKKVSDELTAKGKSVFSELYARVINKMSQTNEGFKDARSRISSLIRILNKTNEDGTENPNRPPELNAFEESLQKELDNWDTTVDVEITPPDLDEIFKVGTTVWVNDGIRTDINRKGQGLQRAMIFALVRSLAVITRKEREAELTEEESIETPSRKASKSTYFILEEPELYLHPQAQRELFESLLELSKAENQVILCTHSSSFLNLDHYRSICVVRKNSLEEGTTVLQFTGNLFPDDEDKRAFNTTYWINPDRGELFFARKVVLVEGATEKTIIPFLANRLGVFRHDYTLIDCGSKDSIPSYLQVLNNFKIPYVVVYDQDHQTGKTPDAINVANSASQRIESAIDIDIGQTIVLINDIEEEIGLTNGVSKSKPFMALLHVKPEEFVIPTSIELKIKKIYA